MGCWFFVSFWTDQMAWACLRMTSILYHWILAYNWWHNIFSTLFHRMAFCRAPLNSRCHFVPNWLKKFPSICQAVSVSWLNWPPYTVVLLAMHQVYPERNRLYRWTGPHVMDKLPNAHLWDDFARAPPFRTLDWTCCHRTPLCKIYIPD